MFFFGMMQNGVRGFNVEAEAIEEVDAYGINWDDY